MSSAYEDQHFSSWHRVYSEGPLAYARRCAHGWTASTSFPVVSLLGAGEQPLAERVRALAKHRSVVTAMDFSPADDALLAR